ncbi:MAG TPA: hypothetical protein VM901_12690 [Bdellovibrionota bacterium]|jgi:hypothetical protein|nr:hypothetical protein [Bdellovibrionota bacterium]
MKRWWILKDRLRHGPFTHAELVEHVKTGRFTPDDFATSDESPGVQGLSHRPLREVLGADTPLVPAPLSHANPNRLAPIAVIDRRDHAMRPDDVDAMPQIRDLIAKIEAIELIDSTERAAEPITTTGPVQHTKTQDLFDSATEMFRHFLPVFTVLAVALLIYAFWKEGMPTVSAPSTEAVATESRQPAAGTKAPTSRSPQSAPRVNVPKMSERAISGFERRPSVPEVEQRNLSEENHAEDEGVEPEASRNAVVKEAMPDRGIASRRERMRQLRNAMSPPLPGTGEESVPGVAPDVSPDQENYDASRDVSGEESEGYEGEEEPPSVEEGEQREPASEDNESVDAPADVEYQE